MCCKPAGLRLRADGAWELKPTPEQRFLAAAATNARLVRRTIAAFRQDTVRGAGWLRGCASSYSSCLPACLLL